MLAVFKERKDIVYTDGTIRAGGAVLATIRKANELSGLLELDMGVWRWYRQDSFAATLHGKQLKELCDRSKAWKC